MPFGFIIDDLASMNPVVGRMFGCYSVYIGEKIVLILRQRKEPLADNGVWIATTAQHHESLASEFPSMRSIEVFGPGPSGWQVLPEESDNFEAEVTHLCKLVLRQDLRIGKIPAKKSKKSGGAPRAVAKKLSAKKLTTKKLTTKKLLNKKISKRLPASSARKKAIQE